MASSRNTRREEIRQADRQVKFGHYIKHEDMKAWLLSWGTNRELPSPKCVCGKNHDAKGTRRKAGAGRDRMTGCYEEAL